MTAGRLYEGKHAETVGHRLFSFEKLGHLQRGKCVGEFVKGIKHKTRHFQRSYLFMFLCGRDDEL